MNLDNLPVQSLEIILGNLTARDYAAISVTCSQYRDFAQSVFVRSAGHRLYQLAKQLYCFRPPQPGQSDAGYAGDQFAPMTLICNLPAIGE